MEINNLFYKESNKTDLLRLALAYFFSIGLTLFFGYLYSIITTFMPLIYANFLITIGFGILLGITCRLFIRLFHIRGKKNRLVFGVIIGLLANIFQWSTFILFALENKYPSFGDLVNNLFWILNPQTFFSIVLEINKYGLWDIGGTLPLKGSFLSLIWVSELLIIFSAIIISIIKIDVYPFSETFNKWYPKFTLSNDFQPIVTTSKLLENFYKNPIEAINNLDKGMGLRHSKIHIFYLENEEKQYLTIENISYNSKGRKEGNVVVNNFIINKKQANVIMNDYKHKLEWFDVI